MNIILKPLVTEKMTGLGEKLNRYGFLVRKNANKIQIKRAVEKMYNVTVKDVQTANYRGKSKTRYTKSGFFSGKANDSKKALVSLAAGETIDFYSSI